MATRTLVQHPTIPGKRITRQYAWQLRQMAKGCCRKCPKPLAETSVQYCAAHQIHQRGLNRALQQRHFGYQPWQPGGQGRKPIHAQEQP